MTAKIHNLDWKDAFPGATDIVHCHHDNPTTFHFARLIQGVGFVNAHRNTLFDAESVEKRPTINLKLPRSEFVSNLNRACETDFTEQYKDSEIGQAVFAQQLGRAVRTHNLDWKDAFPGATDIIKIHNKPGELIISKPFRFAKLTEHGDYLSERGCGYYNCTSVEKRPVEGSGRKVFISGPMTGYKNFNRDNFNSVAGELLEAGDVVLNPAILPDGLTQREYMVICCSMLQCATHVVMLNKWEESPGATAEHALAKSMRIKVEYYGS